MAPFEYDRSEAADLYRSGGMDALQSKYGQAGLRSIAGDLRPSNYLSTGDMNQYGLSSTDMGLFESQFGNAAPQVSLQQDQMSAMDSLMRSGPPQQSMRMRSAYSSPSFDGSAFQEFYNGLGSDQQGLIQGLMNRVGSFYRQQYSPMMGGIMGMGGGYGMPYGVGYGSPYGGYGMMGMGLGGYGMPYGGYGMSYGGGYGMPYGGYGMSYGGYGGSSFSSGSSPFGSSTGGNGFYG